jgi:ATP-binding cassette subfamily B protein
MSAHVLQQQEDEFKARLDTGLWWKLFQRALHLKRFLVPARHLPPSQSPSATPASRTITRWTIDGVVEGGSAPRLTPWILAYAGVVPWCFCTGVWVFIDCAGAIANHLATTSAPKPSTGSSRWSSHSTTPARWAG